MDMKKTKNNFAKHYFINGLSKCSQIAVVCLILHLISFPVTLGIYTVAEYTKSATLEDTAVVFYVLSVIFSAIAIGAGVMMAIGNFSYLHRKYESDTYYSLPLSNKQRFWCDYFSGLASYIVPVVIAQITTFCVSLFTMHFLPDMKKIEAIGYETSLGNVILKIYALAIVLMIMFYTVTVLACVLCGNIVETILSTILLNCIVPGIIALLGFITFNKVQVINWADMILPLLGKTSPAGGIITFLYNSTIIGDRVFQTGYFLKFIMWILFFTVIYAGFGFLLYKKRKAEAVSKPYVFKGYYYTLVSCITFAICSIIPVETVTLIVPMIIVATVMYMIFEMISNRGFKNLKSAFLRNFATIACSLVVIALLNTSWGFGAAQKLPDADDVESVSFDYINAVTRYYGYYSDEICPIEYTDKDIIKLVSSVHEQSVKDMGLKRAIENYSFDYDQNAMYEEQTDNYYKVTYTLKNGKVVTRNLYLSPDEIYKLTEIETTKQYVDNILKILVEQAENYNIIYVNTIDTVYSSEPNFYYDHDEECYVNTNKDFDNFVAELLTALKTDLSSRTLDFIREPEGFYCNLSAGDLSLFVYESDVNIVRVIEKYLVTMEEDDYYYPPNDDGVAYIDEIVKQDFVKEKTNLQMYYAEIWDEDYSYYIRRSDNEEIMAIEKQLMNAIKPYTFDENVQYAVSMNYCGLYGRWYVSSELNEQAQKLFEYAKAENPNNEYTEEVYID